MWSAYWLYYVLGIIMLPGIIFAAVAQAKVTTNYNKYSAIFTKKGIVSKDMARIVLDKAGLTDVRIESVSGNMSDHYDPKTKTVRISNANYNSSSIAALGVTAHEIGHAIQDAKNYVPMRIRGILIPFANFINYFTLPLIILGIFMDLSVVIFGFSANIFILIGLCIFGLSILINLVTLPVEYNASARTKQILLTSGLLDEEEFSGVKKVLNSAALTYVAALLISVLSFLRFLVFALMSSRKRD